ncbi:MAG: hypothetical protein HY925_08980, partial [Elusimicrobia bacterium]|nr:hypothetical protein [Elusimicrobiota bacterium]
STASGKPQASGSGGAGGAGAPGAPGALAALPVAGSPVPVVGPIVAGPVSPFPSFMAAGNAGAVPASSTAALARCEAYNTASAASKALSLDFTETVGQAKYGAQRVIDQAGKDVKKAIEQEKAVQDLLEDAEDRLQCEHGCETVQACIGGAKRSAGGVLEQLQGEQDALAAAKKAEFGADEWLSGAVGAIDHEEDAELAIDDFLAETELAEVCLADIPDEISQCRVVKGRKICESVPYEEGLKVKTAFGALINQLIDRQKKLARPKVAKGWCKRHDCFVPPGFARLSGAAAKQNDALRVWAGDLPAGTGSKLKQAEAELEDASEFLEAPEEMRSRYYAAGLWKLAKASTLAAADAAAWEGLQGGACGAPAR